LLPGFAGKVNQPAQQHPGSVDPAQQLLVGDVGLQRLDPGEDFLDAAL